MNDEKKWYASRGIWGAVVAVLSGVGGIVGWAVSPADAQELVALLAAGGSTIGGIVAWYGRVFASSRVV